MSVFPRLPFYKKTVILLACLFSSFYLSAQVKLRIEPGVLLKTESENIGLMLNFEPNLQISHNSVIGLRFGIAVNSQKFKTTDNTPFFIDEQNDNAVFSFITTYDYYLNENYYRPYLGLGIGYYLLNPIDVSQIGSQNIFEGSMKNQLGLLLRGGFEVGKTKLGLEYNIVPNADIEIPNDQIVGSVNNSYFGLSIGFLIGRRSAI